MLGSKTDDDSLPPSLATPKALEAVQDQLGVHASASRAILTHLCQRLARLEDVVQVLQQDSRRLRADTHRDTQDVRSEVLGMTQRVDTMSSQLNEYASVMDLFQNEMDAQKRSLSWLVDSINEDKNLVKQVDEKVDQQHDMLDSRISELSLRIEDIPRALAALQDTRRSSITDAFTFRTDSDKLSLQSHLHRTGSESFRTGGAAPYTDLAPFTIPDDMRAKVEARIRERELVQSAEQARAELAEAYRRLQLAAGGNPRMSELRMQVEQCQEEIKRAFSLIRTSNLQLYACCEAKAERLDTAAIQRELQLLRERLAAVETGGGLAAASTLKEVSRTDQGGASVRGVQQLRSLLVANDGGAKGSRKGVSVVVMDGRALQVAPAQVPELRVSLLELSRNLNVLKHRWKKRKRASANGNGGGGGVNPLVLAHLDKLVAMINDAYSSTAEEPVDLAAVSRHVDKVARALGSDFSVQILSLLGGRSAEREVLDADTGGVLQLHAASTSVTTPMGGARDLARALCRYSDAFSDVFFRDKAEAQAAEEYSQTARGLKRVAQDVGELARRQAALEAAVDAVKAAAMRGARLAPPAAGAGAEIHEPAEESPPAADLLHVSGELQQLKQRVGEMSKTFATEQALLQVQRQLDQWRTALERPPSSSRVHLGLALSSPLSVVAPPSSISIARRGPVESAGDAGLALALDAAADERPRSQPKLDPLQVRKLTGEPRPGRVPSAAALGARTSAASGAMTPTGESARAQSALGKIQLRAQVLRPRSNR